MLNKALQVLKKLEYGQDVTLLSAVVDDAIAKAHGDAAATKKVEAGLLGILTAKDSTHNAKDYACRKLQIAGGDASVPALSEMLADEKLAHMARVVLESLPGDAATKALMNALPNLNGAQKIGVVSSLGSRKENGAVATLASLLGDKDGATSRAAALALGAIRTKDAAKALANAKPHADAVGVAVDASLACAESILAGGDKAAAKMIYMQLIKGDPAKHIKVAATKGMLACAGK